MQFVYELFLDEKGEKIFKFKGNGLLVEEWLKYVLQESLSYYNFVKLCQVKKFYFDVILCVVDEYMQYLVVYVGQDEVKQLENLVWYIYGGNLFVEVLLINFVLMLNLVFVVSVYNIDVMWGFIGCYVDGVMLQIYLLFDQLVGFVVQYFQDFVELIKIFWVLMDMECVVMEDLLLCFKVFDVDECDVEVIQIEVFLAGKLQEFDNFWDWFKVFYEVFFG